MMMSPGCASAAACAAGSTAACSVGEAGGGWFGSVLGGAVWPIAGDATVNSAADSSQTDFRIFLSLLLTSNISETEANPVRGTKEQMRLRSHNNAGPMQH